MKGHEMSFETHVRERVEAVLSGDTKPEELTGATSVRCAVGLVLRNLEGITTLSEDDAWDYLDSGNATTARDLRGEYWYLVEEWRELCEAAKAKIADAEEARRKAARDARAKADNDEWKALFDEIATRNATQAELLSVDGNVA
jgi:hypothetical protein